MADGVDARLEEALREVAACLAPGRRAYLERMYGGGLARYAERLRRCGFAGLGHVLDAGCGFGQWSLALAGLNRQVSAVDSAGERLMATTRFAAAQGVGNLAIQRAEMHDLPFTAETFDAVFCYQVLQYLPWREALAEFARVLKPGGLIYLNASGIGWFKHLWYNRHNEGPGEDPTLAAAQILTLAIHQFENEVLTA